jgi:hypothetical protein
MGAEWIKMRSVRSTIWTLTAMTVITLGIAIIAGAVIPAQWHTFPASQRATFDPTSISLRGLLFGQLVIGVLGVMVMIDAPMSVKGSGTAFRWPHLWGPEGNGAGRVCWGCGQDREGPLVWRASSY